MKRIFLFLMLLCAAARADNTQTVSGGQLGPSTTNAVPALTTNACTGAIPFEFGSQQILPLWIYYNASNTVNGIITFTFSPASQSTNLADFVSARTNQFIFPVVTSGLSNVVAVVVTNNTGRYLKWTGIENTNTYSISNIVVKAYQK